MIDLICHFYVPSQLKLWFIYYLSTVSSEDVCTTLYVDIKVVTLKTIHSNFFN